MKATVWAWDFAHAWPAKVRANLSIKPLEINRTNVMLIVGPKEEQNNTVSVRRKISGDLGTIDQDMLISQLVKEIKDRSLTHS